MPGLTEKASGEIVEPAPAAIARARRAWEESMLRQLDELRETVSKSQPEMLAFRSGITLEQTGLRFSYWNRPVNLSWPDLEATYLDTGKACPVFDLTLFLFHLRAADGTSLADRWIGFGELLGGAFYKQAFQGYSGDRLAQALGEKTGAFHSAAKAIRGWQLTWLAENAYGFQALPRLRLAAVIWPGDEEFPSRASILFDAASSHYMTTDGLAILGSGLVSRLTKAVV